MKKYIIITLVGLFTGCASNKQDEGIFNLLHIEETLAYKSITIKDIIGKKDFN